MFSGAISSIVRRIGIAAVFLVAPHAGAQQSAALDADAGSTKASSPIESALDGTAGDKSTEGASAASDVGSGAVPQEISPRTPLDAGLLDAASAEGPFDATSQDASDQGDAGPEDASFDATTEEASDAEGDFGHVARGCDGATE